MLLKSKQIHLRPLEEMDAQQFLNNTEDQELRIMTETKESCTLRQTQQHISLSRENSLRYDFAICLNENDQIIGELSISNIDENNSKSEGCLLK